MVSICPLQDSAIGQPPFWRRLRALHAGVIAQQVLNVKLCLRRLSALPRRRDRRLLRPRALTAHVQPERFQAVAFHVDRPLCAIVLAVSLGRGGDEKVVDGHLRIAQPTRRTSRPHHSRV